MNKLIARLIKCGMTRDVAVFMSKRYKGQARAFELYVESIEEASREPMEEL